MKADFYYLDNDSEFIKVIERLSLEKVYTDSIIKYLTEKKLTDKDN